MNERTFRGRQGSAGLLGLALAFSLVACGTRPAPEPRPDTLAARPVPADAPSYAAPDASPPPPDAPGMDASAKELACAALVARFQARHDRVTLACRVDADCACYPETVVDCGGIVERSAAEDLGAIAAEYWEQGCPRTRRCAPWRCEPVCAQGRCANGAGR